MAAAATLPAAGMALLTTVQGELESALEALTTSLPTLESVSETLLPSWLEPAAELLESLPAAATAIVTGAIPTADATAELFESLPLPSALPLSPAILAGAMESLEAVAGELSDQLGQLADALAAAAEGDWSKLLPLLYVAIALAWRSSVPRSPYLQGGYAPVRDKRVDRGLACEQGRLPPDLAGWYGRAGPNPYFDPPAGYHW